MSTAILRTSRVYLDRPRGREAAKRGSRGAQPALRVSFAAGGPAPTEMGSFCNFVIERLGPSSLTPGWPSSFSGVGRPVSRELRRFETATGEDCTDSQAGNSDRRSAANLLTKDEPRRVVSIC
jgi:hypothetical protein